MVSPTFVSRHASLRARLTEGPRNALDFELANLVREFSDKFSTERILDAADDALENLFVGAQIDKFLPLLVYRRTRAHLRSCNAVRRSAAR